MSTDTEQQETSEQLGYIRRGLLGRFFGSLMHVLGFAVVGPLIGMLFMTTVTIFFQCGVSIPCLDKLFPILSKQNAILNIMLASYILGFLPAVIVGVFYITTIRILSPDKCMQKSCRILLGAILGLLINMVWSKIFLPLEIGEVLGLRTNIIDLTLCGAIAGAICAALMGERFYRWCFYRRALK